MIRRAAGALAATLTLLTLLIGIPVALVALAGNPLPSADVLSHALTRPDDGDLFLSALACLGWAGWASFLVATAVEIPAQLHGRSAPRIRGLGAQQGLAGALVTTMLMVAAATMSAASASAAPASNHPVSTTHTTGHTTGVADANPAVMSTPGAPSQQSNTPATKATGPTYTVQSADTLWDIAADHLGDGTQWKAIAHLNYGHAQADGTSLDSSHTLQPGWVLHLPAAAHAAKTASPHTHTVQAGETLSDIAATTLGDPTRYHELATASAHTVQPDGTRLTDPDDIRPGWLITVPTPPAPEATPAPLATSTNTTIGTEQNPTSTEHPAPAEATAPKAAHPGTNTSPSTSTTVAPAPETTAVDVAADDSATDLFSARTTAGVGSLLAASLLGLLGAKRRRQQRRRPPGQRIPMPTDRTELHELEIRAVEDPLGLQHIDTALRDLAIHHRLTTTALPRLTAARLTTTHLELFLDDTANLPAPWTPSEDRRVWLLPHADLHTTHRTHQHHPDARAPWPSLVTIGQDSENAHVLIDLENVATLAIDGAPHRTLAVITALAVELATSCWGDDLQVTLVGTRPELAETLDTGRVRHLDSIERLIVELEGRAEDVARIMRDAGVQDLETARGRGVAMEAWAPEIVLLAEGVPPALRDRLDLVLHQVPRVGIAAVTGAGDPLGEWILRLDPHDVNTAVLDPAGLTLAPQQILEHQYADLLQLLQLADDVPVPGPAWAATLPTDEINLTQIPTPTTTPLDLNNDVNQPHPPTTNTTPAHDGPLIRVLGPIDITGARGPAPKTASSNHTGPVTELLTFLSLRGGAASGEEIAAHHVGRTGNWSLNTVHTRSTQARKWLGNDDEGRPYLPRASDTGRYELRGVRTDWDLWLELVGDDASTTPVHQLMAALDLVRAQPFEGANARQYLYAEPLRQEMIASIVDVAHHCAHKALQTGDSTTARRAAAIGRLVDGADERIWRDALRAEYLAHDTGGLHRITGQLLALTQDLDTELEDETEHLLAELERSTGQALAL